MQPKKTAVLWFTNNLRVQDNKVLQEACLHYNRVLGVYCFNKHDFTKTQFGFKKIEKFRAKFLIQSVQNVSQHLKKLNISLAVFFDYPEVVIPNFCLEHNADAIFFQKEFTHEEVNTIEAVTQKLPQKTAVFSYYDQFLFHPNAIPFAIENIPEVFTNFRKKVEKYAKIEDHIVPNPKKASNRIRITTKIPSLHDLGFQDYTTPPNSAFPFSGGEREAMYRLQHYFFRTKKLSVYKKKQEMDC